MDAEGWARLRSVFAGAHLRGETRTLGFADLKMVPASARAPALGGELESNHVLVLPTLDIQMGQETRAMTFGLVVDVSRPHKPIVRRMFDPMELVEADCRA